MTQILESFSGRVIPIGGTESNRILTAPLRKPREIHSTTQGRLFLQDVMVSRGKYHGHVGDEVSMLALFETATGCAEGDWCFRSDLGEAGRLARCIANNGSLLADWFIFPSVEDVEAGGGGGGDMTAEEIRDALATLTGADRLDYGTALKNLPTIPSAYTLPTASDTIKGGVKIGEGLVMDGEVLKVSSIALALMVVTWLSADNFDGYTDGLLPAPNGGVSWSAAGSGHSDVYPLDNYDDLADADPVVPNTGMGWIGDGEAATFT